MHHVGMADGHPSADWARLVSEASRSSPVVVARTFRRDWSSFSRPVLLACNDNREYVVKAPQANHSDPASLLRSLVNDHVVADLGAHLQAPLPRSVLVEIPPELVAIEANMQHLLAGLGHGTELLLDCGDRANIAHITANRERYAALAVLYGWCQASDHQMIFENDPPHLVHSVDHGHFFGGPNWTTATLAGAPTAEPDALIVSTAALTPDELRPAGHRLVAVTNVDLATAVALPPDEWGLLPDERVALARYLAERRDRLVHVLGLDMADDEDA